MKRRSRFLPAMEGMVLSASGEKNTVRKMKQKKRNSRHSGNGDACVVNKGACKSDNRLPTSGESPGHHRRNNPKYKVLPSTSADARTTYKQYGFIDNPDLIQNCCEVPVNSQPILNSASPELSGVHGRGNDRSPERHSRSPERRQSKLASKCDQQRHKAKSSAERLCDTKTVDVVDNRKKSQSPNHRKKRRSVGDNISTPTTVDTEPELLHGGTSRLKKSRSQDYTNRLSNSIMNSFETSVDR